MSDQADHLRLLVHGAQTAPASGGARLVVVVGAKGGVGTTTIALHLAAALSRLGLTTALVDGDLGKADLAAWCGVTGGPTIVDVLSGRTRARAALQPGPAGAHLLAGAWATGHLTDCDASSQRRLIDQLKALRDIDFVVIDAGCGQHRVIERFWRSADDVLLIATPEDAAVMGAYGTIKAMAARGRDVPVRAVINQERRPSDARSAFARLQNACRRFLAIELTCVANILFQADGLANESHPFDAPNARISQFIQSIEQLARRFGTQSERSPGGNVVVQQVRRRKVRVENAVSGRTRTR